MRGVREIRQDAAAAFPVTQQTVPSSLQDGAGRYPPVYFLCIVHDRQARGERGHRIQLETHALMYVALKGAERGMVRMCDCY